MEKNTRVNRIFQAVEDVTGINRILIVSKSRDRDCHFARMIVAHHLRAYGFRYGDISDILGRSSESNTAYLLHTYAEEQTPYFKGCAEKVERILNGDGTIK